MVEYLEAIDELIKHYNGQKANEINSPDKCPLCTISIPIDGDNDCGSCPWTLLEGAWCCELSYDRDNKTTRLKRLRRWKKIIKDGSNE